MSAVDSSKHLKIGSFLGVPVYQLLEDNHSLAHRNPQDRHQIPKHCILPVVPKGAILIGGGSGEHPAIAFYDPTHCVARYLEWCLRFDPSRIDDNLKAASAHIQGDLQTIEYCKWTNQDHMDFRKRCDMFYSAYQEELTFEGWLLAAIGEFIFHVIPAFSPRVSAWRQDYADQATCWFSVICVPYGDRPYGGNGRDRFKIIDTEPSATPNDNLSSPG